MNAAELIHQIENAGVHLVLVAEGVGFDKPIPDNLLSLARQHKAEIRAQLEAQQANNRREGLKRLEAAAAGLPITLDELALIFADDLEDFGTGAVSVAGIRQACEFYARGRAQPQREEIPAGMVRCTDCQQDRCKHKRVTPWGSVEPQSSPQWRWCRDYTARVHQISDYRR